MVVEPPFEGRVPGRAQLAQLGAAPDEGRGVGGTGGRASGGAQRRREDAQNVGRAGAMRGVEAEEPRAQLVQVLGRHVW